MAIELSCTGCGRTLRVGDDAAGKHARCPACGQVSRVSEPAGAEAARIVRFDTGELPGFVNGVLLRSWVPAMINQVCNLFGLLDALWNFGEERRCIHDLIAQTVVIDA